MDRFLPARFREARLPLTLLDGPLRSANRDVFEMDILQTDSAECFRIWRGHATNVVTALSSDPHRRQLVLVVTEPGRAFTYRVPKAGRWPVGPRTRILRETSTEWVLESTTYDGQRRFLCGLDEQHLFIAQISAGSTVRQAHESLRPRDLPPGTVRQGEWFFAPLTVLELNRLVEMVRAEPWWVRRRQAIGEGRRPHVADELVRDHLSVYARGAVRHPDHKAVVFPEWRRVIRNLEITATDEGVYWID